ncbi:MAG: zf-HC2 domain-containing protein [Clostridiales bacterium]|jgi:hypothetical protein|nr:zf-HC2 domain-containing protein [Clostridiales bacterium]
MTCDRIEELLSSYLEEELDAAERNRVEEHLKTCPSCSFLLAGLREVKGAFRGFPEAELSEGLRSKLYAIPRQKKPSRLRLKLSLDFLLQPSLQPMFAAATVFMILVSFYVFNPNKKAVDRSIDRNLHLGYSQVEKLYAKAGFWADRLKAYKDNILVSIKEWNLLGGNEDKILKEEESPWKKRSS